MSHLPSIVALSDREHESIGDKGERLAARYLTSNGYRIVMANFTAPVGRNSKGVQVTGEIDIIALDGDKLCFVEVKTRRSDEFTPITTNIDIRKQRQIIRTARAYKRIFEIKGVVVRYDAVTVLMPKHSEPVIELIKGFWDEKSFRKRSWGNTAWT